MEMVDKSECSSFYAESMILGYGLAIHALLGHFVYTFLVVYALNSDPLFVVLLIWWIFVGIPVSAILGCVSVVSGRLFSHDPSNAIVFYGGLCVNLAAILHWMAMF